MQLNKIYALWRALKTDTDIMTLTYENLTDMEKELIMGTLLGDAHIQKRGGSYRLKIEHGIDQKDYVLWKYKKLTRLCTTTQAPVIRQDNRGFSTVQFYLSSGKYLERFHNLFYKRAENGRYVKTITPELIEALPISGLLLAAFFMDDGSIRDDCYAGKLSTHCFSLDEHKLLETYLLKYNIATKIVLHTRRSGQYYLSIPAKSFPTLVKYVESTVREIPSLVYKLNDQRKPRND